jgi:hypothetical protein
MQKEAAHVVGRKAETKLSMQMTGLEKWRPEDKARKVK